MGKIRTIAGRGRRYAIGTGLRIQRTLRRDDLLPGLLSVVVPCYNVEAYLGDCLVSLRFQRYRQIEIIVVDDGSPDACYQVARAQQRRDPRIRIVRQENQGLSAARNTGVEHARGEYLAFVDSDDVVAPEVFSAPIAALRESGSDFAITHYNRLDKDGRFAPAARWVRRVHQQGRRLGETLDTAPDAMVNAVAWSKVYRREFWDTAGLSFPVGQLYEDQPVSMAAFASASTFDVLPNIGVHWRIRGDQDSITQAVRSPRNLAHHNDTVRQSLAVLRNHGHERAAQIRTLQLLANNLPNFTRHLIKADAEYWQLLRTAIDDLAHGIPHDFYVREVNAQDKVLYELIIADRQDDAARFLSDQATDMRRFPTRMELGEGGTVVHAVLPLADGLAHDATQLSDRQLELAHRVMNIHWEDGDLVLSGWAFIQMLDLVENPPTISLSLVSPGHPVIPFQVETFWEPHVDRMTTHQHVDSRPGGFRARLEASDLPESDTWAFEVAVTVADITRKGLLDDVSFAGPAGVNSARVVAPGRVALIDHADQLTLTMRSVDTYITQSAEVSPNKIPADTLAPPGWPVSPGLGDGTPTASRTDGTLEVVKAPVATDWRVTDDELLVEVAVSRGPGAPQLVGPMERLPGTSERLGPGRHRLRFPLHRDVWGYRQLALRTGKYAIELKRRRRSVPVRPSDDVLGQLPSRATVRDMNVAMEVFTDPFPRLALTVEPPLAEDERGQLNQRRLREAARLPAGAPLRDSVFFRSLYGEVANGNMLGIHDELGRRTTELIRYWSVTDYSVPIPEGGVPVIEGSREWHEALAQSRYHVVNVHQLDWFEKPEGQIIVQTMHGYPYKVMGHDWWDKGGFPGSQVASFDRRARDWDYLVSPATYATPLLTKAFLEPAHATPEVLEIGYPRNDVLFSEDGARKRASTREALGIRPTQTVVLYAPTFRDYLSADDMAAQRVDFFNAAAASRALGEDFVILVRGHAFHARAESTVESTARVIDVTLHPDVNQLILASDAAILDYSSLRFDYGITDKPMIFLVPDLKRYDASRGGVIPFAPTAPGPHVATTAEVVELLRDLADVSKRYAGDRERFVRDYVDLDDGHAAARLVDAVFGPR